MTTTPQERLSELSTMLSNRLRKNARQRRRWAARTGTDAYRLYDRDIPEIPLAIDRYGDHVHIADARFDDRRESDDDDAPDPWIDAMIDAVQAVLTVDDAHTHLKSRRRQRGSAQYGRLGNDGAEVIVEERGLKFVVNLDDYLDTGLFLDHRPLRARVGEESRGLAVLNLFAYTGSFTVHAAAGGARSTLTSDLSATYLAWAERNLAINGLDGRAHRRVRADTFELLRELSASGQRFGRVVLDPPTFSNSKRTEGTFDVQRDHMALIERALSVVAPGGVLYFSTNRRKFQLAETLAEISEEITASTVPDDFQQRRPHRAWRFSVGLR